MPMNIGEQFDILTVSFDPTETPESGGEEERRQYVHSYGRPHAEEGWHFLTGDAGFDQEADRAPSASDMPGIDKFKQFAHASGIMVLTPEGKVSRVFLRRRIFRTGLAAGA